MLLLSYWYQTAILKGFCQPSVCLLMDLLKWKLAISPKEHRVLNKDLEKNLSFVDPRRSRFQKVPAKSPSCKDEMKIIKKNNSPHRMIGQSKSRYMFAHRMLWWSQIEALYLNDSGDLLAWGTLFHRPVTLEICLNTMTHATIELQKNMLSVHSFRIFNLIPYSTKMLKQTININ